MDSRAGSVSEAFEAGAGAADVMKHATHTQLSTTMGYNRSTVVQSARVAELRKKRRTPSPAKSLKKLVPRGGLGLSLEDHSIISYLASRRQSPV
jgi:hypothetical protein